MSKILTSLICYYWNLNQQIWLKGMPNYKLNGTTQTRKKKGLNNNDAHLAFACHKIYDPNEGDLRQ